MPFLRSLKEIFFKFLLRRSLVSFKVLLTKIVFFFLSFSRLIPYPRKGKKRRTRLLVLPRLIFRDDPDLDSSLIDCTKKLRLARDQFKKKAKQQQNLEEDALHIDQLVAETREKVEAIRATKARAAESRRQLEELQSELAA